MPVTSDEMLVKKHTQRDSQWEATRSQSMESTMQTQQLRAEQVPASGTKTGSIYTDSPVHRRSFTAGASLVLLQRS